MLLTIAIEILSYHGIVTICPWITYTISAIPATSPRQGKDMTNTETIPMRADDWVMKSCRFAQAGSPGKVMIIMRGVSGSGKSTKAKQLGHGGVILSTDDFWGPNYAFDPSKIAEAHAWNQDRAMKAISSGISPIVIDNMNLRAWEAKPYVDEAVRAGYEVRIEQSDDPMWRKFGPKSSDSEKEKLVSELARRNKHGVPMDAIKSMVDAWEHNLTIDDILKSNGHGKPR
jgi:hypothetical protein